VRGFLHRPELASGDALVLTHGAGGNARAPLLAAAAEAFAASGAWVLRCDLPFRQRRPFGPPGRTDAAGDRENLRQAVGELRRIAPGRIFLGGHSYGGRQATMLAAEDPQVADGLLLFSYPLHPPKKPGELRTAHFGDIRTPAMFVHGTNDGFGSVEEMTAALRLPPAATALIVIEKAGHDLFGGKFDMRAIVVERFREFRI
jgi:predicted alpha/beta-hydrolase family hydrolase